jgi:hypothetical protein
LVSSFAFPELLHQQANRKLEPPKLFLNAQIVVMKKQFKLSLDLKEQDLQIHVITQSKAENRNKNVVMTLINFYKKNQNLQINKI